MSPALLAFRRAELEACIEQLISLLDIVDGDPDLEPDLDGENGTWFETDFHRQLDKGADENLEDGNDTEDDPSDLEPWIGWTEAVDQSTYYRLGSTFEPDREENGDEIDHSFCEDEFTGRFGS
jgi:hypothetical protein